MKYLIIVLILSLTACIDIPTQVSCTPDGWQVNPDTKEIMVDETGAAVKCNFS